LSRELINLGHEVHLIAGPPYPEVVDGVTMHKVESLQLYDRLVPLKWEICRARNPLQVYEIMATAMGTFPEPYTFSVRAYLKLRELLPKIKFDVIHDNQCLGYGLLMMKRLKVPVIATIHHPITVDKKLALAAADGPRHRFKERRWYSFTLMQGFVARRLDRVITVSHTSARDIAKDFKVPQHRIRVVYNGVDIDTFKGNGNSRKDPNSLITMNSGSWQVKGTACLLEALHLLRQNGHPEVKLTVVGKGKAGSAQSSMITTWGLENAVTFTGTIDKQELIERYSASEIAVVPSMYEGFGLPAAEAMSCGVPVIATTGGALPEVVGEDKQAGILVPPADPKAMASAIGRLLDDEKMRTRMGQAGRERAKQNFCWKRAAEETVRVYEEVL